MSARHRDALAHLLYGVGAGGGFILLTGEVGTGKTTINRALLEQLPQDTDIAIILNPALNALELLATACDELHIDYDPDNHSLKTLTDKLHAFLLENHSRGRNTVLMIDEAQHLDFDVLEQIRLLTNLETNTRKLLQIILIGQPELVELLSRPELRQLNQRITARYNLDPLNLEETSAYIRHRLQVAGLPPGREVFPAGVVRGVYRRTRGIPRLINVLCDRMMLGAYGRNKQRVDGAMLKIAAREVMGEEQSMAGGRGRRSVVAAAVLLVVALGIWYGSVNMSPQTAPAVAWAPNTQAIETPAEPAAEFVVEPPVIVESVSEPAEEPPDSPAAWLLPPEGALTRLWSLSSVSPMPAGLCDEPLLLAVRCIRENAQIWEELLNYNRPVVLQMVTPERFGASTLLLGMQGSQGYVATASGVELVELSQLGPLWTGDFLFLWQAPEGYELPLAVGDTSSAVSRVAMLFAQLDKQSTALADSQFNNALKQRVILFQRQHQLEDDGVVGLKTLLKLNELLGIDVTADTARSLLDVATGEVVVR